MRGIQRVRWSLFAAIPLLLIAAMSATGTLVLPTALAQAGNLCNAVYNPVISAADFTDSRGRPNNIDNKYFPLVPGTTFVYQGTNKAGETERVEVRVTNQKKTILGVTATVVRDEVTVDGQRVELTFDWFAQHDDGTVWYFGEDSTEFPSGAKTGSWEAGVNGAKPGIIMQANPQVGQAYRQEFAAGVAEDFAEVRSLDAAVSVPKFSGEALNTRDGTCLEPGLENKYYASAVGLVLETGKGKERLELIEVKK